MQHVEARPQRLKLQEAQNPFTILGPLGSRPSSAFIFVILKGSAVDPRTPVEPFSIVVFLTPSSITVSQAATGALDMCMWVQAL